MTLTTVTTPIVFCCAEIEREEAQREKRTPRYYARDVQCCLRTIDALRAENERLRGLLSPSLDKGTPGVEKSA